MVIMLFPGFKAIRRIARLALIAAIGFAALALTGLSLTGCPMDRGIKTVARPTATPKAGPVASGIKVELKTETPGADIFYTTNGKTPTKYDSETQRYSDPISITPPKTITVIAVKYGMYNSAILTAEYTVIPEQMPSGAMQLTENKWADGNLTASADEQWFKFTATANPQYIHVGFGTLSSSQGLYVQVYDSSGAKVGTEDNLYGFSGSNRSRPVTAGQEYYIKVRRYNSYNGTYQIAFNKSSSTSSITITLPSGAIQLTENKWADGNLTASTDEQWFKFTATTGTQYIHANFGGTMSSWNGLYIQVYDSSGAKVETEANLYDSGSSSYKSRTVTSGQVYYIKVRLYSSNTGTYQIAFAASSTAPPITVTLPSNAIQLTMNTWADGELTVSIGEQWFKFTATANPQYILANFETVSSTGNLYVQVCDSNGVAVGDEARLFGSGSSRIIARPVTTGQEYYIKVRLYGSYYTGTYQIAFNTSPTAPPITLPINAIQLTAANTWADGELTASSDVQWFKFSATANPQYIHVSFGTLSSAGGVDVQMYDSSGVAVGDEINLWGYTRYISRPVTAGQMYYIKVRPYSSSSTGTYQIGFTTSMTAPSP
ncbi:MAG: chitobiase/beta-hexosaminidase C-terminal domain-containing protein [Treponema sp.]|jgi:hypothetical protein|nr:chitobiase/beta-hexosaminidase C-terminal domain-containing protein [Treponema sp.]